MRQATGKSGYLDVKLPAKARGRGPRAWKAWKRRWIVLHGLHDLGTGGTVVTLDMYHNANVEGQQLERSTIYLEAVTLLQRAASRSHPYAFCIEAKQTVVHLAAPCESDTQEWMDVFRNVLWPAVTTPNIDAAFSEAYPVAVIDTNFSTLFGVRGGACHLLISDSMLLLRCTYTDHVLLEWPPTALARVYLANAPELKDQGRVFVIEPRPHCGGWTAPLHFFSTKAQDIVKNITKSMRQGKRGDTLPRESCGRLPFYPEVLSACRSSYAGGFSLNLTESMEDLTSLNSEFLLTALYDQPRANSTQFYPNTTMSSDEIEWEKLEMPSQSYYDQPRLSMAGEPEVITNNVLHGPQNVKLTSSDFAIQMVRKSKSESDLLDNGCRAINSRRITRSDSTLELTLITLPPSDDAGSHESENVILRNKRTRDCTPDNMESICSSISSRDSGVQLSSLDESSATEKSVSKRVTGVANVCSEHSGQSSTENAECRDTKAEQALDLEFFQTEQDNTNFIQEAIDDYHSLSNTSSRTSTSESSSHEESVPYSSTQPGIYAEINTKNNSNLPIAEPMYEDLDRFRKDINKLLGIPHSPGQHLAMGGFQKGKEPPPLPPRCTRLDPKVGSARKKDMIRFLGIDDPLAKEMIRVQQATVTPSPKDGVRRKNLYRFLGVDSKTASAPVPEDPQLKSQRLVPLPLGSTDGTYDVPPNQLRYMAPSNPKLQRGESRSRKFSGNLLRLFKEKDPDSQFNFPPTSSDLRSQTLPANKSSIRRSNSTGIPSSVNTNNAPIMFGSDVSPELNTNNQDTNDQPHSSLVDKSVATDRLADQCTDEEITNMYDKFSNDLAQGIWKSVKECLSAVLSHEIESNVNEEPLQKNMGLNNNELENVSNKTADEITSDSVYLDMTAKLRHFANTDSGTANRDSAMYQAMFLRTLSSASYVSIDMNRVQSLLANSAQDAALAAELRSENTSSDFLKFAQELAEMSRVAFNENATPVPPQNFVTISNDNAMPVPPQNFVTVSNDNATPVPPQNFVTVSNDNASTDNLNQECFMTEKSTCSEHKTADKQTPDEFLNCVQETYETNSEIHHNTIQSASDVTNHVEEIGYEAKIDSTVIVESSIECPENLDYTKRVNDSNSLPCNGGFDTQVTESEISVHDAILNTTPAADTPPDSLSDLPNCDNDKHFPLPGTIISENSDSVLKVGDTEGFIISTTCLKDELPDTKGTTHPARPNECCGDCLVENWALHTAEFDDPVRSLTLCCQQAQVTEDDTTDDIAHQFVSILRVCLRSDESVAKITQDNEKEAETTTLINAHNTETSQMSSNKEDITRPASPIPTLTENLLMEIEQYASDLTPPNNCFESNYLNETDQICSSDHYTETFPIREAESELTEIISASSVSTVPLAEHQKGAEDINAEDSNLEVATKEPQLAPLPATLNETSNNKESPNNSEMSDASLQQHLNNMGICTTVGDPLVSDHHDAEELE